jgi:hypothetical protein
VVIFLLMRCPVRLGRVVALAAVAVALVACAPGGASASSSPSTRGMDEPDRGSAGESRPPFFVLCTQSP